MEKQLEKKTKRAASKIEESVKYHLKIKNNYIKFIPVKNGGIKVATSTNLKTWKQLSRLEILPRKGYFDEYPLKILDSILVEEGILLFYQVQKNHSIGAALLAKSAPDRLIWRTANPIYQSVEKFSFENVAKKKRKLTISLLKNKIRETLTFTLDYLFGNLDTRQYHRLAIPAFTVERSSENPIIQPRPEHHWECCATFNAAAIYLDKKIHFIYRAIGNAGMSVLGYASSQDGIHINERLKKPAYLPKEPFEFRREQNRMILFSYCSGGGWGGCEDPRLTKIDDTIYMTYTAFNGAEPPGVALTSINVQDFINKKWQWKKSVLLSPRGEIHKNWVIFPEKIAGKYAILHSISPNISIEYFNSLDFHHNVDIKSYHGHSLRNGCWDSNVRGVGPTPIKTDAGWLILYHAMDKRDPNRYKLGAMVLDHDDPTNVLYRALNPILEPDLHYENCGYKKGVIYSCGAVVIGDQLFIYYGGADTVSCAATASLTGLMNYLKKYPPIEPEGVDIKQESIK
jgi:predicted GH43/DUF377 family glycosyl hydrolase